MSLAFGLFAVIVFAAFATEAMAGFGSILIAVTLGAHLLPVRELVPLVVPLNVVLTSWIVGRHHAHVAWRLLLTRVLPLMGIGVALGQLVFHRVEGAPLELGLAILVVVVAARELIKMRPGPGDRTDVRPLGRLQRMGWIFGAGVVHGIYATGGPPLVYVLGRTNMDKSTFRSTLATVWLTLNLVLTVTFLGTGRLGGAQLPQLGLLIPVVVGAIVVGELLHHRIPDRPFRVTVFSLLLVAGLALLLS